MIEKISSLQNPKIKHIVKLQKASERKKFKEFVIEGTREVELALSAGYEIVQFFFNRDVLVRSEHSNIIQKLEALCVGYELNADGYSRLAYREGTEGLIVLAKTREHSLEMLTLGSNPLVLVLEAVEKPGNLGAILRTADAAALDAVIVCDALTDIYNPNLIRSSLGCVFNVPLAISTSQEAAEFLKKREVSVYATSLQCNNPYHQYNYNNGTAFVMGTEAVGLSRFWREVALCEINIPMKGMIDSLNVSTAAAVFVFEAKRQRGFL
jgi:RNA methyltransferase, TrmH family